MIYELMACSALRFGELRKAIPEISNTMLASTLKNLENHGLVHRKQFNEIPPHVEYSLTESGQAFCTVLTAIGEWSTTYYMSREQEERM